MIIKEILKKLNIIEKEQRIRMKKFNLYDY